MSLSDLRTLFWEWSGRADLTTSQVDQYLNMGQRLLDQRSVTRKSEGVYFEEVGASSIGLKMDSARVIREVFVIDSGEGRTLLEKKDLLDIQGYYSDPDEVEYDTPTYWAPALLRGIPDTLTATQITNFLSPAKGYVQAGSSDDHGLVFYPPADASYVVEVWGSFWTPDFSSTITDTHWSLKYPEAVVYAGLSKLDRAYRNREGAAEWLEAVDEILLQDQRDGIEEVIEGVDQFEG